MKIAIKPIHKLVFWLVLTIAIFLGVSVPLGVTIWKTNKINANFETAFSNLSGQDQTITQKGIDAQKINDLVIADSAVLENLKSKKYDLLQKRIQEIKLNESPGFIIITDALANTITETNENSTPLNILEEYKDSILPLYKDNRAVEAVAINRLSRPVIIAGKAIVVDGKNIAYVISGYYFDQDYLKGVVNEANDNLGLADKRGLILSSSKNGSEEQNIYSLSNLNFSLKELLNKDGLSSPIKKIIKLGKTQNYLSAHKISLSSSQYPLWLITLKKEPSAQNKAKAAELQQAISEGRLYLKMDKSSYSLGQEGSVSLMADSAGAAINAIGVVINYRSDLMEVKGINFSGSLCSIIVDKKISPENGTVEISCGVPYPGISVFDKKVATLMIVAKQKGTADFSIDDQSARMLINNGEGSNIFKYSSGAVMNLGTTDVSASSTAKVATGTTATSSTSSSTTSTTATSTSTSTKKTATKSKKTPAVPAFVPSKVPVIKISTPENWCEGKTSFIWLKEDGVEKYEYELNTSMLEMKNPVITTETSVCLDISDPEQRHFFHLRAIAGSEKSQMSIISIPSSKTTVLSSIPRDSSPESAIDAPPTENILEDVPEINVATSTFDFFKAIGEGTFRLFGVL